MEVKKENKEIWMKEIIIIYKYGILMWVVFSYIIGVSMNIIGPFEIKYLSNILTTAPLWVYGAFIIFIDTIVKLQITKNLIFVLVTFISIIQ